eukprot:1160218-Pelagomonas_calceolata.AAC.3
MDASDDPAHAGSKCSDQASCQDMIDNVDQGSARLNLSFCSSPWKMNGLSRPHLASYTGLKRRGAKGHLPSTNECYPPCRCSE